jgi:hypothetical protein
MAARVTRTCTVCCHDDVSRIDLYLARGGSCRGIADKFGLHYLAVWRHRKNHLSPAAKAAFLCAGRPDDFDVEKMRAEEGESLLGNLAGLRGRLLALLQVAEELDDTGRATQVHRELTRNLEVTAKVLHQIGGPIHVHQSAFLVSQDYLSLRHSLMKALKPFPQARAAVASANKAGRTGSAPAGEFGRWRAYC